MVMILTQMVLFFKPPLQLTIVEQLDPFDIFVMEEPIRMLPRDPSYFCHNHFNFEISMEVSISDVSRCIDFVPENFVLKSLYKGNIDRFCASP